MNVPANRECLTMESLYDGSYTAATIRFDRFCELMTHASQELAIPVGLLRLTDRFDLELAPARGNEFDSGVSALDLDLRMAAKRHGRKLDGSVRTLDDYIRLMNELY